MKVLLFVHSMAAGGAERVTATLANHWVQRDWSVGVVTLAGRDQDFYSLDSAVRRITLDLDRVSDNVVAAIANNRSRVMALRRVLRGERPDAVISMMTTANCLLALAGRGLGIRLIGSERIHPPRFPLGSVWETLRRWTYPRLGVVVAQTTRTAEWLSENVPGTSIEVIANPVKVPLPTTAPCVDPGSILAFRVDPRMLLAVGRLDAQKGFDRLIRAFAAVAPTANRWILVILGEGPARNELAQLVASLDIADRVYMPGSVGNIGDWYEAADLYALTSRFEGFPNCLLEAMAYDLASVTVDCDAGPADLVRNEVDAILVPEGDHERLTRALDRLMQDDGMRAALAMKAGDVRQRFSVDRIAGEWATLLHGKAKE